MRKFITLVVCLLIVGVLVAKNNFKPAIVFGFNNDTLRGYIDYRTNNFNETECRYKASEKAPVQSLKPGEIAGYRFLNEGKYYISHEIVVDSLERDTVFLEYLVQGVINLYYYSDNYKFDHYLFEFTKGELIDITKERDKITNARFKVENAWYSASSNYVKNHEGEDYKNRLAFIFQKSPRISARCAYVEFERKNMIDLTSTYNKEMGANKVDNIVFDKEKLNSFFNASFSLYGGGRYCNYVSIPKYLIQNYSIDSRSVVPVIAGQISVVSQRITKSVALIADFSLSPFIGASDYIGKYSSYYFYRFNALEAGTNIGLKYTYLQKKWQPFAEITLSNSFFLNKSSQLDTYDRYFIHEEKPNYLLPENTISGYRFTLGCNYVLKNNHALITKVNYQKLQDYKDQISVWEIMLGYRF